MGRERPLPLRFSRDISRALRRERERNGETAYYSFIIDRRRKKRRRGTGNDRDSACLEPLGVGN